MKWASHLSTKEKINDCVDECVKTVCDQLDGNEAHLTMLFISPEFKDHYHRVPDMIRERMKPGILLGCSGRGIIGGGNEAEHRSAFSMTCVHMPDVNIQPIHSDTMNLPDQDTSPSVWREWLSVPVESNPHFILLADPFSFQGEEFLTGIDFAYPKSAKIGGLASGANNHGGNVLYLDDKMYSEGMVGVALSGNIEVDTIVAQGCRPIGQPVKITKCKDNLLHELDNKAPLEVLESLVESMNENDRKLVQTSLFLGIEMDPLMEDLKQGDFLIRNIIGFDQRSGGIAIGAMLREGQLVQFHLRDKLMSAEDLSLMLTRYHSQAQSQEAQGALLFSCLGRGEYLYGKANHDSDLFKDKLGNIPLGGFFCNGEIGPVGKTTYLHGYTSSFGIFRSAAPA